MIMHSESVYFCDDLRKGCRVISAIVLERSTRKCEPDTTEPELGYDTHQSDWLIAFAQGTLLTVSHCEAARMKKGKTLWHQPGGKCMESGMRNLSTYHGSRNFK